MYFAYLAISVLLFLFKDQLYQQMNFEFLLRFLNFWAVLGMFFLVAIWVVQEAHIRLLKKDIRDMEDELYQVKSKLYDANKPVLTDPVLPKEKPVKPE